MWGGLAVLIASNTPSTAQGMMPSSAGIPVCPAISELVAGWKERLTIVNDFPLPVCPYAKMVLLNPFIAFSTRGATFASYKSGVVEGYCNSLSDVDCQPAPLLICADLTKGIRVFFFPSSLASSFLDIWMRVG